MVSDFRVHDLLRVEPAIANSWVDVPDWVPRAIERAPWVVVRRQLIEGAIAIGVRGSSRSERFATTIRDADVVEALQPSDLVSRVGPRGRLPTAFHETARSARDWRIAVYPIGAFAFELASNVVSTHEKSDLDLLVVADGTNVSMLKTFAAECLKIDKRTGVRLDIEVAIGERAVALREIAADKVIAKTAYGPELIACPF